MHLTHDVDSGVHLSLAEINKVLTFSGMTDAGRIDAIRAVTEIDQFLGVFGINYAELKEILALPVDSFKAASGVEAQSPKDIAPTVPPEYVSAYPVPKIDYFIIRDENGLPISPENTYILGMLPDYSCTAEFQPIDLPPESGSSSLFSVAAMRNVLDFFGMSDAGTAERE